jgi:hypothetical protein
MIVRYAGYRERSIRVGSCGRIWLNRAMASVFYRLVGGGLGILLFLLIGYAAEYGVGSVILGLCGVYVVLLLCALSMYYWAVKMEQKEKHASRYRFRGIRRSVYDKVLTQLHEGKLTQKEIGRQNGINPRDVSRIKLGRIKRENLSAEYGRTRNVLQAKADRRARGLEGTHQARRPDHSGDRPNVAKRAGQVQAGARKSKFLSVQYQWHEDQP